MRYRHGWGKIPDLFSDFLRIQEELRMVAFINAFLSYLLLFAVIVALGAVAITVGIKLAKKKNPKAQPMTDQENSGAVNG